MEEQYKEVFSFLHDRNPNARNVAMANILPLTVAGSPLRSLFFSGMKSGGLNSTSDSEVIRDLKLLCRDQPATAHDAFKALVNLSDSHLLAPSLSEPLFLAFIVSYILNPTSVLSDLACMVLSNITTHSGPCVALLKQEIEVIPFPDGKTSNYYPTQSLCATSPPPSKDFKGTPQKERALSLLIDAFASSATLEHESTQRKGKLHFLASVFANISTQPQGREFLLTPCKSICTTKEAKIEAPLSSLLPFTEHPDTIRRGGVVSTIKNCCFVHEAHKALLSPESDSFTLSFANEPVPGLDILPRVLLPLAGPEEFDLEDTELLLPELQFLPSTKVREKDSILRLTHVETLLLLCTTRWGRDVQRKSGVYEIIRTMHETETDENVITHIERLVNMLKRDEAPEEATTGSIREAEESDEDEKIVEV
ncbi:hypothetical protein FRC14_003043 [Serendipita sp. 396]|nr:hypothetical protein FRC14_003043 [Serendipita sp. 396]